MNVGIIIPHRGGEELRTNFANAAAQGFHHAQLVSWDPRYWTEENAREVSELTKEFDIEITAFWCGWVGPKCWNFTEGPETLGLVPVAFRAERIQNILDGAAYAKRLGIADIVTHMGFIPENMTDPAWPGVVTTVKYLAMCLKRSGQNLLFETGQETPVVLLRLFETVNTGNLFIMISSDSSGMSYVRAIPAGLIEEIISMENDIEQPALFRLRQVSADGDLHIPELKTVLPASLPAAPDSPPD